ncbi:MAG: zinc-ribbon domain-containing protein, partial [Turicibacter sp.]|nr:zinc-ribbon domain-containing protein [Turicibacter sp.]
HEWDATLNTRSSGSKCPECRMLFRATAGVDDLATTHPHLAAEWHPTKNGEMKPQHVKAGSGKRVHWQCKHGHEWEAFIAHRSKGNICPHCRKLNSKNKKEL